MPLDHVADSATGDARREPVLPFTTEAERRDLREHIGREVTAFAAGDSRKWISLQARILNGATLREAGSAAGVSEGLVRMWLQAALAPEQPLRRLLRELWETYQE